MPSRKASYLTKQVQEAPDDVALEVISELAKKSTKHDARPQDALIHLVELEDELKDLRATKGQLRGFSTGYKSLDAKMGGLEKGSVILISGETGTGKSAFATNIAVNVAAKTPLLYISLEMTLRQMLERLEYIVPGENPLTPNIVFQKSFALTYRDLEPLIARAIKEHEVEVVVLDYLQYLGRDMEHKEVARMSKEIKSLALKYNVSFLAIVSVRKGSADSKFRRKWNEIEIEDLMGTSAIGYDADTAVLVSRRDEQNEYQPERIYVKVLKTRNTKLDYRDRVVEMGWDDTKITEMWK